MAWLLDCGLYINPYAQANAHAYSHTQFYENMSSLRRNWCKYNNLSHGLVTFWYYCQICSVSKLGKHTSTQRERERFIENCQQLWNIQSELAFGICWNTDDYWNLSVLIVKFHFAHNDAANVSAFTQWQSFSSKSLTDFAPFYISVSLFLHIFVRTFPFWFLLHAMRWI